MSEPMKSSMFTGSNLLIKFLTAALVSGAVAYTAYVSIGDGNISSDYINTIFDQKLQEDPELVTTLCEENLNESADIQAFLENNSDSNITVDNDVLDTVEDRCNELLATTPSSSLDTTSTSPTVSSNETTSDEVIDFDELFYEEYFNVKWYWDVIYWDIATDEIVTPYYQEVFPVIYIDEDSKEYQIITKAFQLWDDALDTVSFEKDDSGSPNAQQITIGLVNDLRDENGLFELEWDENNEIIKASIVIEKDLDEYFLTAVLHEIGNVLGLGDIRTRGDLQSIMEDPYDEIFKDDKLWEFDIKMIKQLYEE
jgi:hypothetical protein|tara:strand:- start:365 stop:1297 length:933 start_codon:yes stop_codon:yes gene_type:complete